MKDKIYTKLFKFSIRKYNEKTLKNLYLEVRRNYLSGKYTGEARHKLYLQLLVLRDKVGFIHA